MAKKLFLALLLALAPASAAMAQEHQHHQVEQEHACPMHPEVRQRGPGRCPECGMALEPVAPPEPQPLRLPHGRDGSGTSWLPDRSRIFAQHIMAGDWMLMLHGALSAGWVQMEGPRGGSRLVSTNWLMGMGSRALAGGELTLRGMFSLEPATAGGTGIPLLLQSGETYEGLPLHDTQHPHDLFMELAALYRLPLGEDLGVELYVAPVGEPALGPPAFMHRPSAMNDPLPPISHHWQDSTHITFGVLSAGVYSRALKLDASWFNGREPDEGRWDFDFGSFDSWSARLTANPTEETSFQVSYGFLGAPEALQPEVSVHRIAASGLLSRPLEGGGQLDLALVWGRNVEDEHHEGSAEAEHRAQDSLLFEANLDLDGKNVPFARLEWVAKAGHDLVLAGDPHRLFNVSNVAVGFLRRFDAVGPVVPAFGVRANFGFVPPGLEDEYGSRTPWGFFAYAMLQAPKL